MRLLPALLILAPAIAAAQAPAHAGHNADPDRQASGGLQVPGWTAHFDRPGASASQVRFVPMGGGYHVTAGPAAIYFDPNRTASGTYSVSATFTQTKAPMHPEAYGLFVGGQNLTTSPSYLYFIVRGDGKYMVKHRADSATVHTLVDWTPSPAVHAADPASGKATNALRIDVGADSVRFVANGQPVAALPLSKTGPLSGVAGIRVNHNLDVHVSDFAVKTR